MNADLSRSRSDRRLRQERRYAAFLQWRQFHSPRSAAGWSPFLVTCPRVLRPCPLLNPQAVGPSGGCVVVRHLDIASQGIVAQDATDLQTVTLVNQMGLLIDVVQRKDPPSWEARVRESPREEHAVLAVFSYKRRGPSVVLTELAIRPIDDAHLSPTAIRGRPPFTSWEKAARTAVLERWRGPRGEASPSRRSEAGGKQERRVADPVDYALVAAEYRSNVKAGLRDPVGEIARMHEVKPGTARAWVYRARKRGLLGGAHLRSSGETTPALEGVSQRSQRTRSSAREGSRTGGRAD